MSRNPSASRTQPSAAPGNWKKCPPALPQISLCLGSRQQQLQQGLFGEPTSSSPMAPLSFEGGPKKLLPVPPGSFCFRLPFHLRFGILLLVAFFSGLPGMFGPQRCLGCACQASGFHFAHTSHTSQNSISLTLRSTASDSVHDRPR